MDAAQKERIFKRFLAENSLMPADLTRYDSNQLQSFYTLLDYIERHHEVFDFTSIEDQISQWSELKKIMDYSCHFTAGPPFQIEVNLSKADLSIRSYLNTRALAALPKDDYFSRPVSGLPHDDLLKQKIIKSRAKLYVLAQSFAGASPFDPANVSDVNAQISLIRNLILPLSDDNPQKRVLHKRLHLLKDLNKVNQLECIRIPQDKGPALDYCILPKTPDGRTEKKFLIKLETVNLQLGRLCANDNLTVDSYSEHRRSYKLATEAIIKLPKYGVIAEVQHEAIALNISRIMGLETTRCTTVSYNNRPALFVPFDSIQLLNEFTWGKTFSTGWVFQGKTYTHYSTIKPVGEGLQADQFISDFGNSLALFYLSCDTDAVGGYCQNKALINSKTLFIFDQVIMCTNKFILDSRLSLQPDQFLLKHTRHGMGRNRTLIEDSSMTTKFQSLMKLKDLSDRMMQYLTQVSKEHYQRAAFLKQALKNDMNNDSRALLNSELNDVLALEADADLIRTKLEERISAIHEVLPKTSGSVSAEEIRQSLIFEKLMHNPVLFSDDGRPYKYPWTSRQANPIQKIESLANGMVQLHFKSHVATELVDFIKRHGGGDSLSCLKSKVIQISKTHLNELREDMLYPEHRMTWFTNVNYLSQADLQIIRKAYEDDQASRIIDCIAAYQGLMSKSASSIHERLECISKTQTILINFIQSAKDKGFGKHVLKKFYFDAQQQMHKMMGADLPAHLSKAFIAAVKLDRLAEFNAVVVEALAQKKLSDQPFIDFLANCIQRELRATNYNEAVRESFALSQDAQALIQYMQKGKIPIMVQLLNFSKDFLPQASQWTDFEEPISGGIQVSDVNLSTYPSIHTEDGDGFTLV